MAITVNTNLPSMAALGHLNRTNRNLSASFDRLASGLRVTKAKDDAAGMAVAENLDTTYRSVQQAIRNTSDGISVIQVAEGSTNEIRSIYQRLRELAVQGASETLSDNERQYLNDEATQLSQEVDRIAYTDAAETVLAVRSGVPAVECRLGKQHLQGAVGHLRQFRILRAVVLDDRGRRPVEGRDRAARAALVLGAELDRRRCEAKAVRVGWEVATHLLHQLWRDGRVVVYNVELRRNKRR